MDRPKKMTQKVTVGILFVKNNEKVSAEKMCEDNKFRALISKLRARCNVHMHR